MHKLGSSCSMFFFFTWYVWDLKFRWFYFISGFMKQFSIVHLLDCQGSHNLDKTWLYLLPQTPTSSYTLVCTLWFTVCFCVWSTGHSQKWLRPKPSMKSYANLQCSFLQSLLTLSIHDSISSACSWAALGLQWGDILCQIINKWNQCLRGSHLW